MKTTRQPFISIPAATILLGLISCLCVGCAKKDGQNVPGAAPKANGPASVTTAPKAVPSGYTTQVTEAEAVAFAKELQQAFQANDLPTVNRLIDWNRIADKACDGFDLPATELAQMKAGLAAGMSGNAPGGGGVTTEIARNVAQGGDYSFVRADQKDGIRRALFRLVTKEGAMNYHAYHLVRNPAGTIVASDIYIQVVAEFLSETARKIMFTMLASRPDSIIDRFTGADRDWAKSVDVFQEITRARNQGRHEEVLRLHETLPESMRRSKALLLLKAMSAQQISEQLYMEVILDFQRLYPGDAALAMVSLDYYFVNGAYDKVLETVEQLDADIPDPYLDIYRANASFMKNDLPNARKYIDRFVAGYPRFINGHDCQATIALKQEDFPAVTETIKTLHRDFQIDPIAVTDLPLYAPYKQSAEYGKLMQYLKESTQAPESTSLTPSP